MRSETSERIAREAAESADSGVAARGETGAGQTITSVERAADVMLLLAGANSRSLGVTEIADQLSLPKAPVHRILSSLRSRGLVELDESTRRYLLGPASMTLGLRYLARLDVRRLALPALHQLSTSTQETATLSLRTGDTRVYVEQVTPVREVIMSVPLGVPFPLHAGASSKALLAFLPEEQVSAYLARSLAALTETTITDAGSLSAELGAIRERGWARSDGERQEGAASVAAPLFDHLGMAIAAVSVCGPARRFAAEADESARQLLAITRRLSAAMGFQG